MTMNDRALSALIYASFWLLLSRSTSYGTVTDVYCLNTLKASLEDPFNYLKSSWDFNNKTEGFICKFTGIDCWHPDENRVLHIRLSNMGLKGQFPRGIENCTSLTGLDLSSNKLSGPIPVDISKRLTYVTSLDLSSNGFSGEIPLSLSNCTYLNTLKLDNNRLTGQIPLQLGQLNRIKTFSVSNNLLSGQIPTFVNYTVPVDGYANNPALCGKPLDPCKAPPRKSHGIVIIGSAIAGVVVTFLVVAVVLYFWLRSVSIKEKEDAQRNKRVTISNGTKGIKISSFILFPALMVLSTSVSFVFVRGPFKRGFVVGWAIGTVLVVGLFYVRRVYFKKKAEQERQVSRWPTIKRVTNKDIKIPDLKLVAQMRLRDLKEATNNFGNHNTIGSGRTGTVYKAMLLDGSLLAIKRFQDSQRCEKQFISELKTLGRMKHRNLVLLLGFCTYKKETLLVYKYLSNKNLHDWLHPVDTEARIMAWPQRLRIGIGLARALAWLHHNCDVRIIHGNISSNCILLDENFEPQISNFGLSVPMSLDGSHLSAFVMGGGEFGDVGYVAPEYTQALIPTLEGDVYSFGIVLLELLTGVKPASESFNWNVVKWILSHPSRTSSLYSSIDKALIGKGFDGEILGFLKVACNCVLSSPNERPMMFEVYQTLRAVGERYDFIDDDDLLI